MMITGFHIFLCLDRIGNSVQIRENTDTIMSIYGKIRLEKARSRVLCDISYEWKLSDISWWLILSIVLLYFNVKVMKFTGILFDVSGELLAVKTA